MSRSATAVAGPRLLDRASSSSPARATPVESPGERDAVHRRGARRRGRRLTVAVRFGTFALACAALLSHHSIWFLLPGALVVGAVLGEINGLSLRETRQVTIAIALAVASFNYLAWRFTIINWPLALIGVPLFAAELHACFHTLGLQVTLWPRDGYRPVSTEDVDRFPIFVLIPTVDEGPTLVEETVRKVKIAVERYQLERPWASIRIVVCNDGAVVGAACSPAVEALARRLGVECLSRTVGGGAKAGNLEAARRALRIPSDALLVIFDVDQQPTADFLLKTVPIMGDYRVGWVQTGQYYRNRESVVARWSDDQQSFFYRALCPGKANSDAAFICGTNVVIRSEALDEIGGFPLSSVTEDFAASIRLAPRWRSVYLPEVLATGLGPVTLGSYFRQQGRWARGTLSVLRSSWRSLLLPRRRGLSIPQRIQYGLAATHYLSGLRDLVFLAAPVIFVLTGLSGVRGATLDGFLEHFVPYYGLSLIAFALAAHRATNWRGIAMGFVSFPILVASACRTFLGYEGSFTLTPKSRSEVARATPALRVAAVVCAVALGVGIALRHGPAFFIADAWLAYLVVLLGIGIALDEADVRGYARVRDLAVLRRLDWGRSRLRETASARPRLALVSLCAGAVLVAGGVGITTAARPIPKVSAAPVGQPAVPYTGLSGLPPSSTKRLDSFLSVKPTILGETEEVGAGLLPSWTREAAELHSTLWITLVFSKAGRPMLGSSLTAITNGMDDAALLHDAAQIAAYGHPVYMTLFPEVDRNYAVTSAVAKGGIPEDVEPAWSHVQHLFRDAGATNVAWVWQPADPGNDRAFMPNARSIDDVAVTLFEYARTAWVNPAEQLAEAAIRHPGKPLLVLVSAAGAPSNPRAVGAPSGPAAKAAWIESTDRAIDRRHDVAAVLYAQSGPVASPTAKSSEPWSLSSGAGSTVAVARLLDVQRAQIAALGRMAASAVNY